MPGLRLHCYRSGLVEIRYVGGHSALAGRVLRDPDGTGWLLELRRPVELCQRFGTRREAVTEARRLLERRRRLLAAWHCEAKRLGLDEETRRALLERVTGLRSAAACTHEQLEAALEALHRRAGEPHRRLREPQQRLVLALWQEAAARGVVRDPSLAALEAFVRRMTGVERLVWAHTPQRLGPVVEALKVMIARAAG